MAWHDGQRLPDSVSNDSLRNSNVHVSFLLGAEAHNA